MKKWFETVGSATERASGL